MRAWLRPKTPAPTTATGIGSGNDRKGLDGRLPGENCKRKQQKEHLDKVARKTKLGTAIQRKDFAPHEDDRAVDCLQYFYDVCLVRTPEVPRCAALQGRY